MGFNILPPEIVVKILSYTGNLIGIYVNTCKLWHCLVSKYLNPRISSPMRQEIMRCYLLTQNKLELFKMSNPPDTLIKWTVDNNHLELYKWFVERDFLREVRQLNFKCEDKFILPIDKINRENILWGIDMSTDFRFDIGHKSQNKVKYVLHTSIYQSIYCGNVIRVESMIKLYKSYFMSIIEKLVTETTLSPCAKLSHRLLGLVDMFITNPPCSKLAYLRMCIATENLYLFKQSFKVFNLQRYKDYLLEVANNWNRSSDISKWLQNQ